MKYCRFQGGKPNQRAREGGYRGLTQYWRLKSTFIWLFMQAMVIFSAHVLVINKTDLHVVTAKGCLNVNTQPQPQPVFCVVTCGNTQVAIQPEGSTCFHQISAPAAATPSDWTKSPRTWITAPLKLMLGSCSPWLWPPWPWL